MIRKWVMEERKGLCQLNSYGIKERIHMSKSGREERVSSVSISGTGEKRVTGESAMDVKYSQQEKNI